MAAHDPTALMDGTYFVSRSECLGWLNKELAAAAAAAATPQSPASPPASASSPSFAGAASSGQDISKVEQCATAVAYLQLARRVFPKAAATVAKLKPAPVTDYDRLHNWKLLQDVLFKAGLTRMLDIEKLSKANYQLNLEFLQWFKRVYEARRGSASSLSSANATPSSSSQAVAASGGAGGSVPSTANARHSVSRTFDPGNAAGETVMLSEAEMDALEKRYYFDKLLAIERLVSSAALGGAPSALEGASPATLGETADATGSGGFPTASADAVDLATRIRDVLYRP